MKHEQIKNIETNPSNVITGKVKPGVFADGRWRIKGVPVWKLTGVTEVNKQAVIDTQIWAHNPAYGLEGWYICAPEKLYRTVLKELQEEGIDDGGPAVDHKERSLGWVFVSVLVTFVAVHFFMTSFDAPSEAIVGMMIFFVIMSGLLFPLIMTPRHSYGLLIKPESKTRKWNEGDVSSGFSVFPEERSDYDRLFNPHYSYLATNTSNGFDD